jgi:hypothetical protein
MLWSAGQTIRAAARAAALEATLPRATGQSIAAAAQRSVRGLAWKDDGEPVVVRIDGQLAHLWTGSRRGDRLNVTVSWESKRAEPRFLDRLKLDLFGSKLGATCVAPIRP